jgi:hypothetical protein
MAGCRFDAPRDFSGASTLRRRIASFFSSITFLAISIEYPICTSTQASLPVFTDPLQKPFYFHLASTGAYQRLGGVGSQDSMLSSAF